MTDREFGRLVEHRQTSVSRYGIRVEMFWSGGQSGNLQVVSKRGSDRRIPETHRQDVEKRFVQAGYRYLGSVNGSDSQGGLLIQHFDKDFTDKEWCEWCDKMNHANARRKKNWLGETIE